MDSPNVGQNAPLSDGASSASCLSDVEQAHLFVGHLFAGLIEFSLQGCIDFQSCASLGGANILERHLITVQRHTLPVLADLAEQAMFDGIPLRCAGRIMANGDGEPMTIAQLLLQIGLPYRGTRVIHSAGVGVSVSAIWHAGRRRENGDCRFANEFK